MHYYHSQNQYVKPLRDGYHARRNLWLDVRKLRVNDETQIGHLYLHNLQRSYNKCVHMGRFHL